MVIGLRREGALAVGAGSETTEALGCNERGELMPILLTKGQPQANATLDSALCLVLVPELPPLTVGFLVIVDECLEFPPEVVGVVGLPWGCAGGVGR